MTEEQQQTLEAHLNMCADYYGSGVNDVEHASYDEWLAWQDKLAATWQAYLDVGGSVFAADKAYEQRFGRKVNRK